MHVLYNRHMDTEEVVQQVQRAPITWEAHEYVHAEKNRDWYWALALFASRKPDLVTFTLSQRGVRVDDDLYPFQSLESFGIDETPNKTPKLILKSNKIFSPGLVIPLEGIHPDEVHDFLLDFLPEGDHAESLSHHLMEYLGF
jgi:hypothetical protein